MIRHPLPTSFNQTDFPLSEITEGSVKNNSNAAVAQGIKRPRTDPQENHRENAKKAIGEARSFLHRNIKISPLAVDRSQGKFVTLEKGKKFYIMHADHLYLVPAFDTGKNELESLSSLQFTEEGLKNLRKKYDDIPGTAAFLYEMFGFNYEYEQLKDMAEHPELFPYFPDVQTLLVPNAPDYSKAEDLNNPKAQKLKDSGIILCGWYMHPELSFMKNQKACDLLEELNWENSGKEKPELAELKKKYAGSDIQNIGYRWDDSKRDCRTIADMQKAGGEYLTSILDLREHHIEYLSKLKANTLRHLKEQYGVNENDDVAMYFHFPYAPTTATLHLHVRVNHGMHPFEKEYSFNLDEIISGLSEGKSINEIILSHQNRNGRFYYLDRFLSFLDGTDGIKITKNDKNIFKLKQDEIINIPSNAI